MFINYIVAPYEIVRLLISATPFVGMCAKAWFPYNRPNRPDRLKTFASDPDDPDDRGDYMEITGSPRSSQSSQTRAHTVEELESV